MLVSYPHKFIYVKTRKTAGSAVELVFEPFVRSPGGPPPGSAAPEFETAEFVSSDGIVGARGKAMKAKTVYYDHMQAQNIRRKVGAGVWSRSFKFCTIRNPWDKTVSAFYFRRPATREKSAEKQIDLFRRWLWNDDTRKNRDRDIYYIDGRPAMDDYIRYHRLEDDVARIADKLGLPVARLPQVHHETRNRELDYRAFYDDEAIERVADMYSSEIADFGWQFDGDGELTFPKPPSRGVLGRVLERLGR